MYSVVIIDDNKIAVTAIKKSTDWKKLNCHVVGEAYNGIDGLDLIQNETPDIAIIDIQMPGYNGLDIIKKVVEQNYNIKFIIISGYDEFEYAQKAIHFDVSEYLLKPILKEEMERAIEKTISTIENSNLPKIKEPIDEVEKQLYEINEKKDTYSKLIEDALSYIDDSIHESISLTDMCKKFHVSTSHFSKCFKREIGIGFASYLTLVKMQNAKILLKNPKNRVYEVAEMLGYKNYTYFFQVFKKYYGYAPSDVKKGKDV